MQDDIVYGLAYQCALAPTISISLQWIDFAASSCLDCHLAELLLLHACRLMSGACYVVWFVPRGVAVGNVEITGTCLSCATKGLKYTIPLTVVELVGILVRLEEL